MAMKKFFLLVLVLFGFAAVGCSDSDDGGNVPAELIGTWDCVKDVTTFEDGYEWVYEYDKGEAYVVFTYEYMTMYDDEDLMSGQSCEYKIKNDKLYIGGIEWCKIEKLTAKDMVWLFEEDDEDYDSMLQRCYFRKR